MSLRAPFPFRLALALALAALLVASCGSRATHRAGVDEPAAAGCRRILTLAPSLTEAAYALGLGSRVVGVDDYSRFPAAAAAQPHLGGLFNPQLERMVALHPDLALLLPSEGALGRRLEKLGIATLIVPNDTISDVVNGFRAIARRCGVPERGRRVAASLERRLAPRPLPRRLSVMLTVGRQPGQVASILVAGRGTFLSELLHRLGAVNAFADAPLSWPQVSFESVLGRQPGAIVELSAARRAAREVRRLQADWRGHRDLVVGRRPRCLAAISGSYTVVPGPRLGELYSRLHRVLTSCEAEP